MAEHVADLKYSSPPGDVCSSQYGRASSCTRRRGSEMVDPVGKRSSGHEPKTEAELHQ